MERQNSQDELVAVKSVVIVGEYAGGGSYDFCSGFVAEVDRNNTYVVTQSDFVRGRQSRLKVCFFDNIEEPATVVQSQNPFCLLRTAPHSQCERIQWAQENVTISRVLVFPPLSPTISRVIPSFVTLRSTESYRTRPTDVIKGSCNYFLVTCPYTQKTMDGFNRLVAAPVFTPGARALGVILRDCRPRHGAEMKVVISAKHASHLVSSLFR